MVQGFLSIVCEIQEAYKNLFIEFDRTTAMELEKKLSVLEDLVLEMLVQVGSK